jgi:hypothetical protein
MYRKRPRLHCTRADERHSPSDPCLPGRGKGWVLKRDV